MTAHANQSFHSRNVVSVLAAPLVSSGGAATVIGSSWIYLRHLQGRLSFRRATLACLLVALLASKVLSPQYLIWVLPLVAIVEGMTWRWLVICADFSDLSIPVRVQPAVLRSGKRRHIWSAVRRDDRLAQRSNGVCPSDGPPSQNLKPADNRAARVRCRGCEAVSHE